MDTINVPNSNSNREEFFKGFKEKLENEYTFPTDYTFKFIVINEKKNIDTLRDIFNKANATFSEKESVNKKYISLTIAFKAVDSTSIIEYYKEVGVALPDVIML